MDIKSSKINLKKGCVLMLVVLINQVFYAQEMPTIIPPSPEAAQLLKFVETPVSHYKGTPNISIPLFEVKAGNISVPISISYHSKGIQVGEVASRVGLGWTLSGGGSITRQVRGKADEAVNGIASNYFTNNFTNNFETSSTIRSELYDGQAVYVGEDYVDMDPDLYNFNFLGFSGKMIIDHVTKEPIVQKYEDLKFTGLTQVVDNQGNQYFFNVTDKRFSAINQSSSIAGGGETNPVNDSNGNYPNAWYLTKIITATKEEIVFNYLVTEERPVVYNVGSVKRASDSPGGVVSFSQTTSIQNQLESIVYPEGSIHFVRHTDPRLDVGGTLDAIKPRALWKIIQKDKSGTTIKTFVLNQDYVTCDDDNNILPYLKLIDTYANKRLYLTSIDEYGPDSGPTAPKLTYSFEYNPLKLPNRHSSSQDVWGYYNGKNNGDPVNNFLYMDNSVSSAHTGAGMLTKINYPTGGYTEFEYEQNTTALLDFADDIMLPYNEANGIPKVTSLVKNYSNYQSLPDEGYSKDLIIGGTESVVVESQINFTSTGDCLSFENQCRYVVQITSMDQSSVVAQFSLGDAQATLMPGNYKLVVKLNRGDHHPNEFYEEEEFSVILRWTELKDHIVVGGKRIKSITKGEGTVVHLKKEYTYEDENGATSGKLLSLPDLYYSSITITPGNTIVFNNESMRSMTPGSSSGGQIGYSRVTEKTIGEGNIGKTVYTFTNYPDTGTYYKFPYHYPNDMEWARGMPVEVKHYKFENGTYQLVNKVKNSYQFVGNCQNPDFTNPASCLVNPEDTPITYPSYYIDAFKFSYPIYRFGTYLANTVSLPDQLSPDNYRKSFFIGGRMHLSKTEETNYFDNGGMVYTENNYIHGSPNHTSLKEKSTTTSTGEVLATQYFYPNDPEMSGKPIVQDMIDANMIGSPLVTKTLKSSTKLSEQEIVYKNWGNSILAPELIQTSKGANALETRIKYISYDTNGNPLEVQQEGGIVVSYIWGYGKTLPIAKIENATNAQIQTALGISDIATLTEASLSTINGLRTSLPNAMVTTFTHRPLIGVETVTDPKGYTMTYFYDVFNRLEKVIDAQGNIVTENLYHYRTQN